VLVSVLADSLGSAAGAGGLGAGGLEGVGHAVVLAGLPDDRVAVVLAAVVDGHPDAEGEGGLALGDVAVADWVGAVGADAEGRVESVEGLLAGPLGRRLGAVVGQSRWSCWWARYGLSSGQARTWG
jgi:hypothetical protein